MFIAEDKDVVRLGLKQMVQQVPNIEVVGTAQDGETAFSQIMELNPDVSLIKDALPGLDGVSLITRLKKERPSLRLILMLDQADHFWHGLQSRADGYFFREVSSEILEPALKAVLGGGAYIGNILADYLLRGDGYATLRSAVPRSPSSTVTTNLSVREKEVLGLLSDGNSNEQIAKHLGLSIQTVKVHVKHILKKMQVTDRTQAVIKALTGR